MIILYQTCLCVVFPLCTSRASEWCSSAPNLLKQFKDDNVVSGPSLSFLCVLVVEHQIGAVVPPGCSIYNTSLDFVTKQYLLQLYKLS